MKRKGFTLIELLAVVVILGVIAVFVISKSYDYYKNGDTKTVDLFKKKITQVINEYVNLNASLFTWRLYSDGNSYSKKYDSINKEIPKMKCDGNNNCYHVNVYKSNSEFTLNNIVIVSLNGSNNLLNPSNNVNCVVDTPIYLYRDSDMAYCFQVKLDCITDNPDTEADESLINTCWW